MSKLDRKALSQQYKLDSRPAGIFVVRNVATGRSFVGASSDLPGMLNRQRFQLELGSHPDAELQADWNSLGPEAFEFAVLDRLEPPDDPAFDPAEELKLLLSLWLQKVAESGADLYRVSHRKVRSQLSVLFESEPATWGLRGDPYLWREMKAEAPGYPWPASDEVLVEAVRQMFVKLTGEPLEGDDPVFVEKYSHGGMSAGHVSRVYWSEIAIPLLVSRRSESIAS